MQHVSTYNSHLQAKLRTVIALQAGCVHLGSHMAYSVLLRFFMHNVTYIYYAIISRVKFVACARRVCTRHTLNRVGLTTLPPSRSDRLDIWEPQPPGTHRSCSDL